MGQSPVNTVFLIDAWFGFQSKSVLEQGLQRAGVDEVLEIWMQISPDEGGGALPGSPGATHAGSPRRGYLPELRRLAEEAQPMALGPLLRVNARAIDEAAVCQWLAQHTGKKDYTASVEDETEEPPHVTAPLSANGRERRAL